MSTSRPGGTASVNQRALLLAAKNDHNPALEELMRCYEPLIGAIVASLRLPCGCERADVAQEARLGLLQAIRAWQPARGPFRAFAALCARNQALKALDAAGARKHQLLSRARSLDDHEPRAKAPLKLLENTMPAAGVREPGESQLNAPLGEQLPSTSTDADPLRIVIAREQLDAVIAARQTMTACERHVLAGMLNDKSQRQLAAELGWSRKTVMLAQRRAREKLAAQHALAA
jgi:RNA polymerase sigma factor (sigma-70 family)